MSVGQKGIWVNPDEFVTFQEAKPPRKALFTEVATRSRAGDFSGFGMQLPNPDEVLRNLGQDITVYKRLLIDAHVGACVISRKAGTKSMSWDIDRRKAPARVYSFIEDLFADFDVKGIIGNILDAPLFGYQPMEVLWSAAGGSLAPTGLVGKPPSWFCFDPENRMRFKSMANPIGEELPPMKFLCPAHDATFENPYGFPLLSRCFWPVAFKKGGYKFWVQFTEKFGGAFAIGKHPRGTGQDEVDRLADMLEALVQSAIAVIPDDSSVEIKESAGKAASADIYERLLLFSDAQVSKALLGQTLTTEIGKTGGAYAASETHMQVRQEIVDGDTDLVIATYNALIRWVVDLNFGTGVPAPGFKMWREKQVSKDQADRDKLLSDTGQVEFTEQYFKREYNFQDGDIIVRPKPEPTPPPAAPAPAAAAPLEPDASEFSEPGGPGRDPAPDQTALDLAMSLAVQPKDLQAAAEPMLRPFIDLVRQGASIEAVMERLVETYPAMNLDELVKILERVLFVAGIWGRLHAGR